MNNMTIPKQAYYDARYDARALMCGGIVQQNRMERDDITIGQTVTFFKGTEIHTAPIEKILRRGAQGLPDQYKPAGSARWLVRGEMIIFPE